MSNETFELQPSPEDPQQARKPHPIQPLMVGSDGCLRFKHNEIVRHLLDNGPFNMNDLAMMNFSQEDREQFAQLIGYSHSGSGDLSYVRDEVWYAAETVYSTGCDQKDARIEALQNQVADLNGKLERVRAVLDGEDE
jgi:hypothetical protein